jgi:hypothetical protein
VEIEMEKTIEEQRCCRIAWIFFGGSTNTGYKVKFLKLARFMADGIAVDRKKQICDD